MASFVEKAVMIVEDKSTKNLSKIQKALRSLNKQAAMTQKAFKTVKFDGISNADVARMRRTGEAMNKMALSGKKLQAVGAIKTRVTVTGSNVRKHTDDLNALAAAQKKIRPTVATRFQSTGTVPAIPAPAIRPGVQRGPMNFNGGVIGQAMGNAFLTSVKYRLAASIQDAIITGFREGTKKTDVSTNNLKLLGLNDDEMSKAETTALRLSENSTLGFGDAKQLLAEVLPTAKNVDGSNNVDRAGEIARLLMPMVETAINRGSTVDDATNGLQRLSNSLQSAGLFTDSRTGDFDATSAETAIRAAVRAQIEAGQELKPGLIASSIAALNAAKYTSLNDESDMVRFLLRAEQDRQAAGVGQNAAINNMAGYRTTAKAANFLASIGLGETIQEKSGTTGGKTSTKTRYELPQADRDLINTSFQTYVDERVIPAMTSAGYDPNNAASVKDFASRATSDRKATSALVQAIVTSMDIRRDVEAAMNRDVSAERIKQVGDESLTVNMKATSEALTAAMGEVAASMSGVLIPALQSVRDVADFVTSFIVSDKDSGNGPAATAAIVGGGVAGTAALAFGGKKILDMLTGIPANTAALTANTAALNRLTGASALDGNGTDKGNKGGSTRIGGKAALSGVGLIGILMTPPDIREVGSVDPLKDPESNAIAALGDMIRGLFQEKKQGPVEAMQDASVSQLSSEISLLTSEIAARKQALPDAMEGSDPMLAIMQADRASLQVEMQTLQASLGQGAQDMAAVFEGGAMSLQQVGPTITNAAAQFGPTAGAGIMSFANQFGAAAGAQIAAAASNIRVNVATASPAPDAGNMELAN